MVEADTLKVKLEAGRAATARALRSLADQIEALPLDDAAEVLAWLQGSLQQLQRDAAKIMHGEYTQHDPLGGERILARPTPFVLDGLLDVLALEAREFRDDLIDGVAGLVEARDRRRRDARARHHGGIGRDVPRAGDLPDVACLPGLHVLHGLPYLQRDPVELHQAGECMLAEVAREGNRQARLGVDVVEPVP